jgi:hypothetical protein
MSCGIWFGTRRKSTLADANAGWTVLSRALISAGEPQMVQVVHEHFFDF